MMHRPACDICNDPYGVHLFNDKVICNKCFVKIQEKRQEQSKKVFDELKEEFNREVNVDGAESVLADENCKVVR